ncbi:chromate resistance protein ChrB domain-containing protein [Streptomyces sp. NPDC058579]|uniref:chromate resistance protein ChrB domain-containing protein n=1 Tax=Streptomyces sp. NPDC058579 TaxID=3346548 RepID=UPI0036505322
MAPPYRRPSLRRIAQIVQEANIDDERFGAPEAHGLDFILRGLSMTGDDTRTMTVANLIFEGLCEYYCRSAALGREPACDPDRPPQQPATLTNGWHPQASDPSSGTYGPAEGVEEFLALAAV